MEPNIAQKGPYGIHLESDQTYYWCACGKSAMQPFCDSSHKGSEFTPLEFSVKATGKAFLCGCKHSKTPPFCDGSHQKL